MVAQLLEAARKLHEASLPPAVPELLSQGGMTGYLSAAQPSALMRPLIAITDELSLDHVTSLATATQDGSDTTATLWAIYAALKSGKLGIQPDDDDKYRLVLEAVTLQIGQMMEPICSGAAFDEGVFLRPPMQCELH
ncbi:hypothetical protein NUW58_g8201 [Xylaria curta]|uniref:Uncharacterized protein n=1 Tax=Xylaria curta TaxID=42375 RepID=A0ACC1NAL2_9PEZI|nr:hypothetical protein NUW58_g8201 [Xylaria curta]